MPQSKRDKAIAIARKKETRRFPIDVFGNVEGTRYDIVRFRRSGGNRVIHRDVSAGVAHLHVNDPRTRKEGVYFDGFRKRT